MTYFVKRKLKDGRQIRSRYSRFASKVLISQEDFEGLLNDSDVAYEQAKQLQTIIENLEEIKAEAVRKVLNKIRTELEALQYLSIEDGSNGYDKYIELYEVLKVIDRHKTERGVSE